MTLVFKMHAMLLNIADRAVCLEENALNNCEMLRNLRSQVLRTVLWRTAFGGVKCGDWSTVTDVSRAALLKRRSHLLTDPRQQSKTLNI
jgi:hypothetical protein